MKLEDELKQTKPFNNEWQKLAINLAFTSSWLNSILVQKLKPYGLSPQQFNVLRILNGKYPEGYCNHEITCRMIDKASNSSRIVYKLLEKGLVQRNEDPNDRRLVNVRITEAGRNLLESMHLDSNGEVSKVLAISEDKARMMNEWLDEMRDQ